MRAHMYYQKNHDSQKLILYVYTVYDVNTQEFKKKNEFFF